jgi:DNA polymerase III sliding clamp (beta) subunit (PCNA family)
VTSYKVSAYDSKTRTSEPPRHPDPWPIMSLAYEPSVTFTMEKKPLIEAVKGVMPFDEHNRVTLAVKPGGIEASAFGHEKGMFVPAETKNEGHRSVNADYLLRLLRAIDGKSVTIGWAQQPAMIISSPEMSGWTILLAPVAMLSGG